MKRTPTELAYLRATAQNASPVGLVIILIDQLILDLKRAIAAMEKGDIETRCAELKHGYLVLAQLQGSLDKEKGGEAAENFSRFYSSVRASMMQANIKARPDMLVRQIGLLLDVRQAWQQVDNSDTTGAGTNPAPQPSDRTEERESTASNWTA